MKRQELERLIKLREAELSDLQQELEQVSVLEEVLASKPFTNKEEVDQRIRAKVIDLLLDNFRFTPLREREEEPISEDVVVLDDEPQMVKQGVTPKQLEDSKTQMAALKEEVKAELEAEAEEAEEVGLQVLVDGQTLDDLEVEEDDEDTDIPSGEATRNLQAVGKKRSPQVQGPQTPQQGLPSAAFYQGVQNEGSVDVDSIPPEYRDKVRARRTDDGSTSGSVRRKS